jgi:hypothetical protein
MTQTMTLSPRWVVALKGAACVFFLGHMAATCAPHVPVQSALQPLSQPFVHYEELTGNWQSWDMFTTIPYLHDYDVAVDVTDADGQKSTTGVTLPGLARYDRSVRNEAFFLRVVGDATYAAYLGGYVRNVCAALRARSGRGGQQLVFHESYERLRWLNEIRENGVISVHEDHPSKTFPCGD